MSDILARVSAPTRVCIAGEDLDWLGGQSLCAAIDLQTTCVLTWGHKRVEMSHTPYSTSSMDAFLASCYPEEYDRLHPLNHIVANFSRSAPSPGGLGTSSALCLSYYMALSEAGLVDASNAVELAYRYEFNMLHGGGMDHLSSYLGGFILTDGNDGSLPDLISHSQVCAPWRVIVIHSRVHKECISHLSEVRRQLTVDPLKIRRYKDRASELAREGWAALQRKDLSSIHCVLQEAHNAMRDIQNMSTETLEDMRQRAERTGLPFKLTGSGSGGCFFTLIDAHHRADDLTKELLALGFSSKDIYITDISKGATCSKDSGSTS